MRILLAWDDLSEAELLGLYLKVGTNEVRLVADPSAYLSAMQGENWDVVLQCVTLPTVDAGFAAYQEVQTHYPNTPILAACRPNEVFALSRFIAHGLRAHIVRDAASDYVFLLLPTLESTVAAVRAEKERRLSDKLREEIDSVRRLQESVIPRDLVSPTGYRLAGRYEPSQIHVFGSQPVVLAGGDYYDAFTLDENRLVLLVGDASGHGIRACMSIMIMHTLMRMVRSQTYVNTAEFVASINRQLCEELVVSQDGGFITLLYCLLDTRSHTLEWTTAGHPAPILLDPASGSARPIAPPGEGGLPLGIYPDVVYEPFCAEFAPGSRLLLFTDGLIEALYDHGDYLAEFGIEGISGVMCETASLPVEESLARLFDRSSAFTGGTGRHDDSSALLLERRR